MVKFPIFQKGGLIPLKFDYPLKLEEIPTKNQIRVIDNYSPNYDYIVEDDKIYSARKGINSWTDISDNNVARENLYNFLGTRYNFRGYEDNERKIWENVKAGKFDYKTYRESQNKPAVKPQRQKLDKPTQNPTPDPNRLVTTRVPTAGGGFTNIKVPAYMLDYSKKESFMMGRLKPEYYEEAMNIAKSTQPERYADPINNTLNWLPFIVLTGGRGLGNMGYNFISPLVNRMAQGASNVGRTLTTNTSRVISNIGNKVTPIFNSAKEFIYRIPLTVSSTVYSTPTRKALTNAAVAGTTASIAIPLLAPYLKVDNSDNSDYKAIWNMTMDGDIEDAFDIGWNGLQRKFLKSFGGSNADAPSRLNLPAIANDSTSMYAFRPLSFVGDTVFVPRSRLYILPEVLDVNEFTFKHRNRGQNSPIESEGAPITAFTPFVPYGLQGTKHLTFIGYNTLTGLLKAGDISQFGPGDYLSGTFSNNFTSFKKNSSGQTVYKRDDAHGNGSRSVPVMVTADGKEGALNILSDTNLKGNTYGWISGGRVLVRVGDELRLLSGSIDDIEALFEEMKKRNKATYGTFYTLDNGSYNRGLRTVDGKFTTADLESYDKLNRGNSGNFLYITGRNTQKFRSDTILTPHIRTINSDSYKNKGKKLTNEQKGIVLHHTGTYPSIDAIVLDLTTPLGLTVPFRGTKLNREASAHVVIGTNGDRKVLATPDKVTFHAGESAHNGRENVNDFMIGIEFEGDTNIKDLTPQLILSAIEYLEPIVRKNNIRLEDIVTHQNVRDLYNDYARKSGQKEAASKPDINLRNYNLILLALLKKIYYKK